MLEWTGDPLLYPRANGAWGMIIHRCHYLFDGNGRIESMQPVCREVVHLLLKNVYKDPAMAAAAYLRTVPDGIERVVTATAGGSDEKQG